MSEQIYNKQQFAERLGVSVRTVNNLMKAGKVKPCKVGRLVKFRESHVKQALDACDTSLQKPRKPVS